MSTISLVLKMSQTYNYRGAGLEASGGWCQYSETERCVQPKKTKKKPEVEEDGRLRDSDYVAAESSLVILGSQRNPEVCLHRATRSSTSNFVIGDFVFFEQTSAFQRIQRYARERANTRVQTTRESRD